MLFNTELLLAVATPDNVSLAAGAQSTFAGLNDAGSVTVDLGSLLAELTGTGSFDLTCGSRSGGQSAQGTIQARVSITDLKGGCGARITYTYSTDAPVTVPEPGALALAGLALGGVAATRRRRPAAA